jgi:ATP-binding cassette subfamily F protein 3
VVYAGVDLAVERGERLALVGVNGAGKSTLLKILGGVLPFDAGERVLGPHVAVHYYAQHQLDALDPARTVLEELDTVGADLDRTRLRTILGAFLFSGDAVDKRVGVLSGGEKARVALAKMLVRPAALLCLDEPTNHLDLASREVLEAALAEFPGTIVFISHDRYFINRIATAVVQVVDGTLTRFPGSYDDYVEVLARPGPPVPAAPAPAKAAARSARAERAPRRRVSPEVRALQRRVEEIERQIHDLETRLAEITAALGDPALYADGGRARDIAHERKRAEEQMAWLMHEWEALASALAAHD